MFVGAVAVVEALIGDGFVQTPQARRVLVAESDHVPARDPRPVRLSLLVGKEACRKIVTEALAHGRGLRRLAKIRADCVLQGMSEFVQDRLAVLGIVDSARAEGEPAQPRAVPGIVLGRAAHVGTEGCAEDGAAPAIAERFQIADRTVDMKINHRLLEPRLCAREDETPVRLLHAALGEAGGHALAVEPTSAIEISEGNSAVRRRGRLAHAAVLEQFAPISERDDRVGIEDLRLPDGQGQIVILAENLAVAAVNMDDPFLSRPLAVDAYAKGGAQFLLLGEPHPLDPEDAAVAR